MVKMFFTVTADKSQWFGRQGDKFATATAQKVLNTE